MNRRPVNGPWGGGNAFFRAYHEFGERPGIEVLRDPTLSINPDTVLLVGLENDGQDIGVEQAIMYKMYVKPECLLVFRVNECDARKGTTHIDDALLAVSEHMDGTVFVSRWMQDYFNAKGWACKNQAVIINGVDRSIFRPGPKPNNGKLNIVAHHWSDNPMKGADVYEKLDELVGQCPDKFAFTYIGRHRCDFKHARVIRPLSGKALGEELGKHDVYVSASRFDPGPNHVLEALACGLPTFVHADGGGCVEFAGSHASYRDWDMLRAILGCEYAVLGSAPGDPFNKFVPSTWQTCVQEYNAFLEATWRQQGSQSC